MIVVEYKGKQYKVFVSPYVENYIEQVVSNGQEYNECVRSLTVALLKFCKKKIHFITIHESLYIKYGSPKPPGSFIRLADYDAFFINDADGHCIILCDGDNEEPCYIKLKQIPKGFQLNN